MQQTGCGGTGRWATLLATVHLDGRRRLAACAMAGAVALLLGISGVAAHGGAPAGARDHGRTAAQEHVTTSVQALGRPGDDRGNGDDSSPQPGEHGDPHRLRIAVATPAPSPTATPSPHGLRLGNTRGSTPAPSPAAPPVTGPPPAAPGTGTATTTIRTISPATTVPAPARTVPPPSTVPPPQPTPRVSLPPLVLIPPLGLPTPPTLNAVTAGSGVVPLVVVLLAMAALSVILGLRLGRRSR